MPAYAVNLSGEDFLILPEKALFHPVRKCLFIADIHLGKITHFRKSGIAVPHIASSDNFERIAQLITSFSPQTIFFLGDVFHSSKNSDWQRFKALRNEFYAIPFILIRGNHDSTEDDQVLNLYFDEVIPDELIWYGFSLTHPPRKNSSHFNLSGHIHPAIRISGFARQSLRLPCFYQTSHGLILPAFGTFTGNHILELKKRDVAYVIIEDEIIKIEK